MALNDMLGQIEKAFAERAASEERLRRFLADASHELRTPLTSIRGYAELFRRGADQPARRPGQGHAPHRGRGRAHGHPGRGPAAAGPHRRGPAHGAPSRSTSPASPPTRSTTPGHAITEREIRLEAWPSIVVPGDRARLHQVAANLLGNAIEHTPPGVPIEVRVSKVDGHAVLDVADHGPGMSHDEAAHVFDRFYRADPSADACQRRRRPRPGHRGRHRPCPPRHGGGADQPRARAPPSASMLPVDQWAGLTGAGSGRVRPAGRPRASRARRRPAMHD